MERIRCFLVVETEGGYRRADGEEVKQVPHKFGPGAMWYEQVCAEFQEATRHHPYYHPDESGRVLYVMTPNGAWCIDSYASNCTRRTEKHHCWCRHGEAPAITVDKDSPNTCGCGCSIAIPADCSGYHGFLRNGYLESC
jgi:hypothetical protein